MKQLHDRINRVIHTEAFEKALEAEGIDLFEFQGSWSFYGTFDALPEDYQRAILAGEAELGRCGELAHV